MYTEALTDKTQISVLDALETIRQKALRDGRPLKVLQTYNGKEFQNASMNAWFEQHGIAAQR